MSRISNLAKRLDSVSSFCMEANSILEPQLVPEEVEESDVTLRFVVVDTTKDIIERTAFSQEELREVKDAILKSAEKSRIPAAVTDNAKELPSLMAAAARIADKPSTTTAKPGNFCVILSDQKFSVSRDLC